MEATTKPTAAPSGPNRRRPDMTTIKASCPCCGDVELTPTQVRLVVCPVADWSFYAFTCGTCSDEVRKPAGADAGPRRPRGGVWAERWAGRGRAPRPTR